MGGWHSARFCLYPQEILIKFPYPVHIRQINLLFHETLIPSRVDIYHFFPKTFSDLMADYNNIIYDKIGYIKPDSNTRSDYQCREYKRIALAENCYFLKLVFQKNINNIYNPFNQVALVNLQCFGFVYTEANLSEIFKDKFHKNNHNIYNDPEEFDELIKTENFDKYVPVAEINDGDFHKKVSDKLTDLNLHLDRAKYFNDYDKAKQINDFINQARLIGYKVEHLNKLKRIAVDKENYPKAKEIKDTTILMGCTLGRDYFVSARKYDPYKWLHRFDKPVLILGAGSDDKVPAEYLEKAAEAFPDANLKMIDHGDHLFTAMARKEALNAVEGFLSR